MDFALLPPEINSGRMYVGPGSGPMLAAAAAWDGLATELHSTATSYGSVISELSAGPWLGAASAAMTAAAAPYVAWMRSTASQAEQTAVQAKAAAAAYEVTFAAMVPPPVIEANRALLQALVATNLFGQNSPGDRCHRDPLRRDVGTRCHGDVRLRGHLGVRDNADSVHSGTADHERDVGRGEHAGGGVPSRPPRRCRGSHRRRRQRDVL